MFKKQPARDKRYLGWIKTLPCLDCGYHDTVPHHVFTGGMSTKCSDYDTIPLCHVCHHEWHTTLGKQGGMSREEMQTVTDRLRAVYNETRKAR